MHQRRLTPALAPGLADIAATLDLLPIATLLLDLPGLHLLAGNTEAARLLGCGPAGLCAAWDTAVDDHEAGAVLRRRLADIRQGRTPEVFDAVLEPSGRPPLSVLVRAHRLQADGRAMICAGLVDITRRQRAESGLATALRRLEVALAGAELGAWHWDVAADRLEVSDRWAGMLGRSPEERVLRHADWRSLLHPEDVPRVEALLAAHVAGAAGRFEAEYRLRHADGRWIPVLSRGEAIERDAKGRALVMSGTHLDLSAQRAAETAQAESAREARRRLAELETLYRSAPLGLAQLDREMRFVRINEALAEMNGLPIAAHIGRSAWELVPDLRAAAEPLMRRVIEDGEIITGIGFTGETPKAPGVKRDWVEQFYPVHDPETAEVVGLGLVCEEVTERRRAERTRELLLRELDHRVKNLFAVISGLVTFSARGAATPEAMRGALLGRIAALARAHDLVRPAIAGQAGGPETTLTDLLRTLLAPFQDEDGLPAERIRFDGPSLPLGPVAAPPLALAMHELATNAAKYGALSRPGGWVAILWAAEGPTLRLYWQEIGGPPPRAPARSGFGHRLVAQSAVQLGGTAEFGWASPGLSIEVRLPLERLRN